MRSKFFLPFFLIFFLLLAGGFTPLPQEGIRIIISNLHNEKGHVLVSLFKDGTGYPDDARIYLLEGVGVRENFYYYTMFGTSQKTFNFMDGKIVGNTSFQ